MTDADCYTKYCDRVKGEYKESIIRLYGINSKENTFLVHARNFNSYFYVECPPQINTNLRTLDALKKTLNLMSKSSKNSDGEVLNIEMCEKESIINYKGEAQVLSKF